MSDIDKFIYTTAIKKIRALKKRKKVIQGSTSAGKTYGIIPVLIDRAIKTPRLKITIVAETIPAVKDGCVDIFKAVMQDTGRWIEDHWIGSPMEYTFYNGSRIQFKSFDTVGKAKAAGKRDILFINEGNHIAYDIADTLMVRSKEIYIDFNADEEFWAHKEVLKEPNSEFLSLTYLDNEGLPPEILEELMMKRDKAFYDVLGDLKNPLNIKNSYWANWWYIYGLGEIGSYSDRRIYSFEIVDEIPKGIKRIPRGMDFGKSPDPTCLIDMYVDGIDLYIDEIFSKNNLLPEKIEGAAIPSIVDELNKLAIRYAKKELPDLTFTRDNDYYCIPDINKTFNTEESKIVSKVNEFKNICIIADSAGATEIRDIRKYGYYIVSVKKTLGSILSGIQRLQSYDIKVTKRSVNAIKGFESWFRKVDANGKNTSTPDGHEPDCLAAARYVLLMKNRWVN